MKKGIHPQFYTDAVVTCACGNSFITTSTKKIISVEICGACHPFYTGQQRFVDTEGRIEKFSKKRKFAEEKKLQTKAASDKTGKKEKQAVEKRSLKDLLKEAKQSK